MKTTIASGTLQTWAIPVLQERVDKLNRRAAKCKCEPLALRVLRSYDRVIGKDALGSDRVVNLSDVEIEGTAPRINGWVLVAKLTPTEGGNFVKAVPGLEGDLDPKYRTIEMRCDHCRSKRRRNDVFVIRNESGVEKVIGRNCLADFIRTADFEAMIAWADFIDKCDINADSDWEGMGGGRVTPTSPILYWLETISICVRKLGWLSRSAAFESGREGSATADTVVYLHWAPDPYGKKREFCQKNDLYATDHDKALAVKALEWVRSLTDTTGDYLYNLKLACGRDYVDRESAGLVSSLIQAYQRAIEEEIKRMQLRKAAVNRGWVGEVKQRLRNIRLTVLGTNSFDGEWGVRTLIRFADENENVLIWWASGDRTEEFEQGATYVVDATVKKHDDHETYGKQTVVNRVTVKQSVKAA